MRVTTKMMSNTYKFNVNNLTEEEYDSHNKLSTGKEIFRASENTAAAVKAYQVRTGLNRIIGYKSNISHANSVLSNSETSLMGVESTLIEAKGKIVVALNDPTAENGRNIIATELNEMREHIFQTMNSSDSGFYLFAGSNTAEKPFTKDENGQLVYNGYTLNDLADGKDDALIKKLMEDELYIDIGLEPEFDADDKVVKNSVLEYSTTGIKVVGYGKTDLLDYDENPVTDENGDVIQASNNLYDLLGEIAAEFAKPAEEFNYDLANALYGRFNDLCENITTNITEVGSKATYIKFSTSRLEDLDFNLTKKQTEVEGVDYEREYIDYSSVDTAYRAALQMGSKLIGPSLFDYMS